TAPPPANWNKQVYDPSSWAVGPTGIGYGDGDDLTILSDMQNGYMSVFLRRTFQVPDPAAIEGLIARVDYDDGFVMYLNGTEVARRNLSGNPPAYNAAASAREAGSAEDINITSRKNLLVAGSNLIAIQVHNTTIDSSDLTMIPELLNRELLPGPPIKVIRGIGELQQLLHVRGIYSRKQLQSVLAEFWENHFTTDFDKVAEIFDGLQNSDASDAMSSAEAMRQAAQVKERMHQFFTENALGNFGDLLLASATDPAMILYLDNFINKVGNANENYGREILELFAFGVDNRYTQKDIEEIAKCFTGWSTRKVAPENAPSFPASAETPPQEAGVLFDDTTLVGLGSGWKYRKGTAEPSPDGVSGDPTTAWTTLDFNAAAWLNGSTGIGYGDGDDATVLSDMRGNYLTVYLRRTFNIPDPSALSNLLFEVAYDDGFVAYIHGVEVTRSENMAEAGSPPSRTALPDELHEVSEGPQLFNLNGFLDILNAGANVLAIQVHNFSIDSSDLSMLPRLIDREILPGSVENGDPTGVWTFYFNPADHDRSAKVLFQGTPYQINIPTGRTGALGLRDALDPIRAMVNHPSTAEFICIKLIEKFVSDELSLPTFKANTAPAPLRALLADAIAAWNSTTPKGNIRTVLEVILDPVNQESEFWSPASYRAKVKTPIELINSSIRVLDGLATGGNLPQLNEAMGMNLLTRDEPDGFSELGRELMSTDSLLERIRFVQSFAENTGGAGAPYRWNTLSYLDSRGLDTAEEIVDHFADLMFHGSLTPAEKGRLLEFLSTDNNYNARPLTRANTTDFQRRVQEFVGFLLSLPQWSFQ
ncbi:MAG TPA: DUF1800 family protein, partial [Planctomycetota bacterium]|nr:DUF1800 family protein [Planctomycetota bacterium]